MKKMPLRPYTAITFVSLPSKNLFCFIFFKKQTKKFRETAKRKSITFFLLPKKKRVSIIVVFLNKIYKMKCFWGNRKLFRFSI